MAGCRASRIRFRLCWGSWHGPHTTDLPMADIVGVLLAINAGAYSFEAANARHEHEWKVWRDVRLPEGKVILPGVVTHSTNVVEHPELVADRIVRFAEAVGSENVVASTDCGRVHPQIAWAKPDTLVKGAELATSQLCGWSRHGPSGIKGGGNRSGTEPGTRAGRVPARVRRPDPGNGQRMTEPAPRIDYANLPAPAEGIVVTMFITVRSVARSRDFYSRVLGGTVVLEENPCIVKLSNSWILMNPGGPPTPDKPGISVVNYEPGDTTSIFLNLRVADIQACYQEWKSKGAEFVTPPIDREAEIRCYMRDPDGYLIEVGQATGALHGHLAKKRPEDLPG